jgi:hypothetical protein
MTKLTSKKMRFNLYWFLEQIWDSEKTNAYFQKKRNELAKSCREKSFDTKSNLRPIKEVVLKEGESPYINVRDLNEPTVFRGFAKGVPAYELWNMDYLKDQYGAITQPCYKSIRQDHYLKNMGSIIESIQKKDSQKESITFGDLYFQSSQARAEMSLESFCDEASLNRKINTYKQFFLAGKGYFTGIHSEMVQSLTVQLSGKKRWYIVPPHESIFLNPLVSRMMYIPCAREINKIDPDTFFNHHFEAYYVDLNPGDVFYMPPFHWHYVEYLEDAISIGRFWTELSTLAKHPLLSFLILTSRNPSILNQIKARGKNSILTYGVEKND